MRAREQRGARALGVVADAARTRRRHRPRRARRDLGPSERLACTSHAQHMPRADREALPTTIWRVWLGPSTLRPLQQAALQSCAHSSPDFPTRLVTNSDTASSEARLGLSLHRGFRYLDAVQAADYLRAELLHRHGGFYLDSDVFCLRNLRSAYDASHRFDASGATLKSEYARHGSGLVMESAAMGPMRANTSYTRTWDVVM